MISDNGPIVSKTNRGNLAYTLLLIGILLLAAYFRLVGIFWGEYSYMHPDERFLLMVGSDISPTKNMQDETGAGQEEVKVWISLGEYFDTANSPLNPNNRGHGFYVYGTLPMFLTRFTVEWIFGHSGLREMLQTGRPLSALADLLTVLLVFLVATRLFDRRVGLLAAAFSAAVVLQIQQSHFFTMDTFINFFSFLAFYFAVNLMMDRRSWWVERVEARQASLEPLTMGSQLSAISYAPPGSQPLHLAANLLVDFVRHPLFAPSLAFGAALGMAVSSKLNAAPMALVLPLAMFFRLLALPPKDRQRGFWDAIRYLALAAFVSLLVFRVFQPYAFSGPGFFGLKPNPQWVANIQSLRAQSSGDVDFPPAMQWARRPVWFSGQNMVLWGLGLPLGLLAWAGFIWSGWRILQGDWRRHALLWGWTGFYFAWQSLAPNPTMRYQLPVYPTLAILAAWSVVALYDKGRVLSGRAGASALRSRLFRLTALLVGGVVLLTTVGWAYAFTRIYVQPFTRVEGSRWIYQNIPGPINLRIQSLEGVYNQPLPFRYDGIIRPDQPYITTFNAQASGILQEVHLPHAADLEASPGIKTLALVMTKAGQETPLATATIDSQFPSGPNGRGDGYYLTLDHPLPLSKDQSYRLDISLESGLGAIQLQGDSIANETDWDDALPLPIDGYNGFGGIYPLDLNFSMYWDDNSDKLDLFLRNIQQADTIMITSSRQWGSLPRIPERFPLTSAYYRNLIGCPADRSIEWCYNVARPGMFKGNLGFDLQVVFQSNPSIGPLAINDQFAEEAFTVYDHPKVFVFQKNQDFNLESVSAILGEVDLSQVVRITPMQAGPYPANLMLPEARLSGQRQGGTWSQLFDSQALHNKLQIVGVMAWYLSLGLLGLFVYPLVRLALPGLPDRGYPLARIAGLLLLSYIVWLLGSVQVPFTRLTISLVAAALAATGAGLAYLQRHELRREWRERRSYFLMIEGLVLLFFLFDLLIRLGNPDLWHPWKGGERPMDFSYFNAVLKSTSFPPYDPWFAGGYLNYYYYGFVLLGVLVKGLGIVPAVAFNLILPTLFSLIALGAFSIAWNLYSHWSSGRSSNPENTDDGLNGTGFQLGLTRLPTRMPGPFWIGLASAMGMVVLGNLGTLRMIFHGYQRLAAPGGTLEGTGFLSRVAWTVGGFFRALSGTPLPFGIGDWYWNPSRVIPALNEPEPITEFPFFTVLYGDPHAHLYAIPVALLALAWVVSVTLSRARWKSIPAGAFGFFLGALAIGALRPTNTWDFYPYLALGAVSLAYALAVGFRFSEELKSSLPVLSGLPLYGQKIIAVSGGLALLVGLSYLLYSPFLQWYGMGYGAIDLWEGSRTPVGSYLSHWGLFLFVIATWMTWESLDWMARTPLSALRTLQPYKGLIQSVIVLLLASVVLSLWLGVRVAWLIIPMAAWSGVLLLRPKLGEAKRVVLFLVGTGLVLTLMVEVIVLRGDIGRMNTVFKFYLQVWTLFAVSAAAALGWLLASFPRWHPRWRLAWQIPFTALVASAALFTLLGGIAKIKDRMAPEAPHTLDGMAFMRYASYEESGVVMDLSEDYRGIRWMQENISGSPVIVEANSPNLYRWFTRYTVYTGLPGVVGWDNHQRQQRALLPPDWISSRTAAIDHFYLTVDVEDTRDFLRKYDVRYIILGQLERARYPGFGLDKFTALDGVLWHTVYQDAKTVIYEVDPQ